MNAGSLIRSAVAKPVGSAALRLAQRMHHREFVPLDFPASADPRPRWGHGRPPHPRLERIIAEGSPHYRAVLQTIVSYRADLARIATIRTVAGEAAWLNGYLPGLDSAAIYTFMRTRDPALYLEVGSGNSTTFAARARADGVLKTKIVSIDPEPRADIDVLCDEVLRTPLETTDLAVFDRLARGDIVFFDGSHRVFMNSDVTVFLIEVLPALPAGILVGMHDIYLPYDYEPHLAAHHYSEQYLLAAYLLAETPWVRPALASTYVSRSDAFAAQVGEIWAAPDLQAVERHGCAFWFTTSAE